MAVCKLVWTDKVGFRKISLSRLQSRLLRERTLRDFADMWPDKFQNKTNGVTQRRFMRLGNPRLSELLMAATVGDRWLTDLDQLGKLQCVDGRKDLSRF